MNLAYLAVQTTSYNPIIHRRCAIIVVLGFRLSLMLTWNDSRSRQNCSRQQSSAILDYKYLWGRCALLISGPPTTSSCHMISPTLWSPMPVMFIKSFQTSELTAGFKVFIITITIVLPPETQLPHTAAVKLNQCKHLFPYRCGKQSAGLFT